MVSFSRHAACPHGFDFLFFWSILMLVNVQKGSVMLFVCFWFQNKDIVQMVSIWCLWSPNLHFIMISVFFVLLRKTVFSNGFCFVELLVQEKIITERVRKCVCFWSPQNSRSNDLNCLCVSDQKNIMFKECSKFFVFWSDESSIVRTVSVLLLCLTPNKNIVHMAKRF